MLFLVYKDDIAYFFYQPESNNLFRFSRTDDITLITKHKNLKEAPEIKSYIMIPMMSYPINLFLKMWLLFIKLNPNRTKFMTIQTLQKPYKIS